VRAVLDVNVLVSALLSPSGAPARLLLAWQQGDFELIVSALLLAELARALAYPRLRGRVTADEATRFIAWLERSAPVAPDPGTAPPARSVDPSDDYLIALAASMDARLVSGDRHLLDLAPEIPVHTPREFLGMLGMPAE